MVLITCYTTCTRTNNQTTIQEITISNLCQKHWFGCSDQNVQEHHQINGETMEANIINLFNCTFRDSTYEWGDNFAQDHPYCSLKSWNNHFASDLELWRGLHAIVKHTITNHWTCWGLLWTPIEANKLSIG